MGELHKELVNKSRPKHGNLLIGVMAFLVVFLATMAIVASRHLRTNVTERIHVLSTADSLMAKGRTTEALNLYIAVASEHHSQMDKWNKIVSTMAYNSESFVFSSIYDDSNRANYCLDRAIQIAKETGEPTCVCSIYFNMGNYYFYYKDFSSASENYKMALKIAEQHHYTLKAWCAMTQLLSIAIEGGNDSTVMDDLATYLRCFKGEPISEYNRRIGQGLSQMRMGNYSNALAQFDDARSLFMSKDIRLQFSKIFEDAKQEGADQALNDNLSQIVSFKAYTLQAGGRSHEATNLMDSLAHTLCAQTDKHLLLNIYHQMENFYAESGRTEELKGLQQKIRDVVNSYSAAQNSTAYRKTIKAADMQDWQNSENDRKYEQNYWTLISCIILSIVIVLGSLLWWIMVRHARNKNKISESQPMEKYKFSNLGDEEKTQIYTKIMDVMEGNDAIFERDFSLMRLAKMVGVHERWVSQVINERSSKNFSALLNEYRVREVCRRMADKSSYGNLTLGAIGESVGFSSRTYFTKVFKKIMSISPSDYYKSHSAT